MKFYRQNKNVLDAEDKFSRGRDSLSSSDNLSQLGERAIALLNDKNLEVSKVRPFFWSLVETYVDRFDIFPFDVNKALLSSLEQNNYPEDEMLTLIKELEKRFEQAHGRPLLKPSNDSVQPATLDEEIRALRDSIKYAAVTADD